MTAPVDRRDLAPSLAISTVVTGLWQVADMERDGRTFDLDAAAAAMRDYVGAGLTTFDMADHYGSAEDLAGRFRERYAPSGGIEFLTKWVPKPGPISKEDVRAAVGRSLKRLKTDRLDLLQFHAWSFADPHWLDCLAWLQDLKSEGLIGVIGLTNVDTAHLRIAVRSGIEITSNQVCYSLLDRRPAERMTRFCLENGIGVLAYGTVAGGFLSERWLDKPEPDWSRLDTWSQMKYGRFIRTAGGWDRFQRVLRAVAAVARKHEVSIPNVACRYILDDPAVGGIIVGARLGASAHIADTMRLFRLALDLDDRETITAALRTLVPIPGDSGDEYRKPPSPVRSGPDGRNLVLSGTEWESIAGFSRAVRHGDRIVVSGTTATHGSRVIGGADPSAQFHFVVDKIEGAIVALGGKLEQVVRTRVFVRSLSDWEAVARAHGERFGEIQPANTLVQAGLVGDDYLVEMEAEAIVPP